jgi:hypothetical protein
LNDDTAANTVNTAKALLDRVVVPTAAADGQRANLDRGQDGLRRNRTANHKADDILVLDHATMVVESNPMIGGGGIDGRV